jgi:putative hydrolase of the HAD superfamily
VATSDASPRRNGVGETREVVSLERSALHLGSARNKENRGPNFKPRQVRGFSCPGRGRFSQPQLSVWIEIELQPLTRDGRLPPIPRRTASQQRLNQKRPDLNIVFDLGGVVFNWQPDVIVASHFEDRSTQDLVREEIFEHSDWTDLDRGVISLERAIDRGAMRTGLPAAEIGRLLSAVPSFLTPIDQTIDLIYRLGNTVNNLFVLSNMSLPSIEYLERQHDIWGLFKGVVISSRVKMVKPDIEIFRYLLDKYRLQPTETVFIDDLPKNLEAASSLGIRTVRFFDSIQCEQALLEHRC